MVGRSVILVLCSAVALLLMGGPASAAPRVPKAEPFTSDPIAGLCDFPVVISGRDAQVTRHTFSDGTQIITGPFVATFTNQVNGNSETYNVSGPTRRSATNFLVITGKAVILQPDRPGIIATSGRVEFQEGQPIPDGALKGHVSADVCADIS
jgi:hypothetical protein